MTLPAHFHPKGLYIHIPFCASRCPYCDFYVIVSREQQQHLRLAHRLIEQLDSYLSLQPQLLANVKTISLGGGTPSLLASKALSYLLQELQARHGPLAELSMESNPELIHPESLELWQNLGLTRLSIGLQSCSDKLLHTLGRHSSQQQHERLARWLPQYFAGQYSFDFIYGIPGQNLSNIEDSLSFIDRHQPHHISYYELSIEEGTLFARKQLCLPSEQQREEQFSLLCRGLASMGYHRYEVSNWARSSHCGERLYLSQHNELYWRWQAYLGLGPGAVGAALLSQGGSQAQIWRAQGSHTLTNYLEHNDFGVKNTWLCHRESLWEYLLMALRLRRGIHALESSRLFWPTLEPQRERLAALLQDFLPQSMHRYAEFFYWESDYLRTSDRGFDLQGAFLRSAHRELLL